MKTELLIGALFFVGMAFAPVAMAGHADDESDADLDGTYIVVDDSGVSIWEEANGHDGLQTSTTSYEAASCPDGEDAIEEDGVVVACEVSPDDEFEL